MCIYTHRDWAFHGLLMNLEFAVYRRCTTAQIDFSDLGKSIARLKLVQLRLCKIRLTFGKRRSKNLAGGHEQSTEPGEWAKLGTRTLTKLVSLARNAVTWCLKHSVLKHDLFIPICSLGCAKVCCVFQNGIWQRLSLSSGLQLAESSWGASTVSETSATELQISQVLPLVQKRCETFEQPRSEDEILPLVRQ